MWNSNFNLKETDVLVWKSKESEGNLRLGYAWPLTGNGKRIYVIKYKVLNSRKMEETKI
jgi:hypothetical protein